MAKQPTVMDEAGECINWRERAEDSNQSMKEKLKQIQLMSIAQQIKNMPDEFFTEYRTFLETLDLENEKKQKIIQLLDKEKKRREAVQKGDG